MTSLFVVGSAFGNVTQSVAHIQGLSDKENIVVIALDFWASKKLRQNGIPYKTPDEYLDSSICDDIDIKAIEMTQTWYKSLGDKLTYKNISLGQMAEYDFGHLFIETLRSIEIATSILSRELPDAIFLPPTFLHSEPGELITMCYWTLPGVLHHLAKPEGICITILKPAVKSILCSQWQSMVGRISIFVLGIATTAYKLYRVIPSLLKANGKNVVLFAYVSYYRCICDELEKGKNACLDLSLISWPATSKEGREKIGKLHNIWEEFTRGEANNRTLIYNKVPIVEILNYQFKQFFHVQAPALIGYIEWAERIIGIVKPDILVVTEDVTTISRAYCRTFTFHGLPVLVMQHGVLTTSNTGINGFFIMPLEASRQAVWGPACKDEWGTKIGKPEEYQVLLGNPKYDFIADGYRPKKSEIYRRLSLDPERGIIVVATEWYSNWSVAYTTEVEEYFIRSTIKALKSFPDKQIVIKLHPTLHKKYWQIVSIIAEEENVEVTITPSYLWELLAVADLVIVSESTVGLDAMVLDKPVVVVNLSGRPDAIAYVHDGAARGAYHSEDIATVVREVLNDKQVHRELAEARKKFVYEYAYIQDGKASRRTAELIMRIIENKRIMELEQ